MNGNVHWIRHEWHGSSMGGFCSLRITNDSVLYMATRVSRIPRAKVVPRPKIKIQDSPRSHTMPGLRIQDPSRSHGQKQNSRNQDPLGSHARSKCQDPKYFRILLKPKLQDPISLRSHSRIKCQDLKFSDSHVKSKLQGPRSPWYQGKKQFRIQDPTRSRENCNFRNQDPRIP